MASILDLDPQTRDLVFRMQLDDLVELESRREKRRSGETADLDLAIEAYRNELGSQAQLISDRAICRSMARAVSMDADLISRLASEEEQAAQDRRLALQMYLSSSGDPMQASILDSQPSPPALSQTPLALVNSLAASYMLVPNDGQGKSNESKGLPESSAGGASRRIARPSGRPGLTECDSCREELHIMEVAYSPCSHKYCRRCLEVLVREAMKDESKFPPRCCRHVITLSVPFLSAQLMGEYQAKKLEFEMPNRTYCHHPACSKFIPKQFIKGDVATCISCSRRTCVLCKAASHGREDCPKDSDTQSVLSLASQAGYQRCYSCRKVVELIHGCNHMTCTCGAQFCYVCGRRWKSCHCSQNETMLLHPRSRRDSAFIRSLPGRVFDGGKKSSASAASTTLPRTS